MKRRKAGGIKSRKHGREVGVLVSSKRVAAFVVEVAELRWVKSEERERLRVCQSLEMDSGIGSGCS